MLLKSGILILLFLGEIALGVYSFWFTSSLIARFSFFVLTCFLVAMMVIKFAGNDIQEETEAEKGDTEKVVPKR